jgi:hypothetical protein
MKSLNTKLMLSALGVALLATPAFAQRPHQQLSNQQSQLQDYAGNAIQNPPVLHYPNGATRSGSAESVQSGAEFNLGY